MLGTNHFFAAAAQIDSLFLSGKRKGKWSIAVRNMPHRYTGTHMPCHMGSHSVTCHPTEVIFPPLPLAKAGTELSDPRRMQG